MATARVVAVNVVHQVLPGAFGDTAIDKRPVRRSVYVDRTGLDGDRQLTRGHGGPDKAVYAYAAEDADWWAAELGRAIPPGTFGENLRTRGLDITHAVIGERWRIGEVVVEVRMPRTPCENLSLRMGIEGFHVRFHGTGRVGAYLRVVTSGVLAAGDAVAVESRPDHGVTVERLSAGLEAGPARRLLDSGIPLAACVRGRARRVVRRASAQSRAASGSGTSTASR